jgi:peptidoglycan hydrolase-like protein with peptidoglycan-binding domain
MTKSGFIFPLYFLLASGCALSEDPEMVAGKQDIVSPVTESQSVPPAPAVALATNSNEASAAVKALSPDEIRRIQARLKEVGLDPGPIDGIAGGKTRTAMQRLQSGCAQVKPLLENLDQVILPNSNKTPGRQETLVLQTDLRNSGFNAGPVDGIFGNRTKSMVTQLRTACPIAKEYAGMLDNKVGSPQPVISPRTAMSETNGITATVSTVKNPTRIEVSKQVAAPAPIRSQEEIRILQLRLRDAGFDPGSFDGVMGPKTKLALQQYQLAQGAGKSKASLTLGITGNY